MAALFAYGTLEFPQILEIVAGRAFAAERPAIAHGYRRAMLRGRRYPGIWPDASASTDGVLYRGLDAEALRRVDRFESDVYRRVEIAVHCAGRDHSAYAYVVEPEHLGLLADTAWNRDHFRAVHLEDYARVCRELAAGLIASVPDE